MGTDRERGVVIRGSARFRGDELVTWNGAHRVQHARIDNAAAFDLVPDHALALAGVVIGRESKPKVHVLTAPTPKTFPVPSKRTYRKESLEDFW